MQPTNMKKSPSSPVIAEKQIKTTVRPHYTKAKPKPHISSQSEWQSLKSHETTDAGEDVEK